MYDMIFSFTIKYITNNKDDDDDDFFQLVIHICPFTIINQAPSPGLDFTL